MALTSKWSGSSRLSICAGIALAGALATTLYAGVFDEPDVPRPTVVAPMKSPPAPAVLAPATGPAWPRLPGPPATRRALSGQGCRQVFAAGVAGPSTSARGA